MNNKMVPYFSVIVPLYNKSKFINETLNSIFSQTFDNYEVIVVDDGSTDGSVEAITILDSRMKVIRQPNSGVSKARNTGIRHAKGRYIAFIDADDLWCREKLSYQYKFIEENDLSWCASNYYINNKDRAVMSSKKKINYLGDALPLLNNGTSIWTGTVIVKREIFLENDIYFNENVRSSEDREMWLSLACMFQKFGYITKPLAKYILDDSLSITSSNSIKPNLSFIDLNERVLNKLDVVDDKRMLAFSSVLNKLIMKGVVNLWCYNKNVINNISVDDLKLDSQKKLVKLLRFFNFLPFLLRVVVNRLFSRYYS